MYCQNIQGTLYTYMFCLLSIFPTILKESKYQLNKQVSVTIYANTTNQICDTYKKMTGYIPLKEILLCSHSRRKKWL